MANNGIGFFDEVIEQGGQVAKQTVKQVAGLATATAGVAVNQVAPGLTSQTPAPDVLDKQESSPDKKKQSDQKPIVPQKTVSNLVKEQISKPDPQKEVQDQTQLMRVRQELHQEYYKNLVNRPNSKDEPVAEKLERQEREEEQKMYVQEQEKKKKELPNNIKQGTGEKITGIGG